MRDLFKTGPHNEHTLSEVEVHEDGIGNSLYNLIATDPTDNNARTFIGFTGEELTSLATQWLKHAMKHNRVVVRVTGGNVQGASADDPTLEFILIDDDNGAVDEAARISNEANTKLCEGMHPIF